MASSRCNRRPAGKARWHGRKNMAESSAGTALWGVAAPATGSKVPSTERKLCRAPFQVVAAEPSGHAEK